MLSVSWVCCERRRRARVGCAWKPFGLAGFSSLPRANAVARDRRDEPGRRWWWARLVTIGGLRPTVTNRPSFFGCSPCAGWPGSQSTIGRCRKAGLSCGGTEVTVALQHAGGSPRRFGPPSPAGQAGG